METTDSAACKETITRREGGAVRFQLRDRPLMDLMIISGARFDIGDPIVDRTALVGRFDIDLEFAQRSPVERSSLGLGLPLDAAVEDQLGLRFERRQERVDFLVIERVTMPSFD